MKKIISFSLVFALVAGAIFAADLNVDVHGQFRFLEGDSGKDSFKNADPVGASGNMSRMRISGAADIGEHFGGWYRFDPSDIPNSNHGVQAYAWWKPIDQLKLIIGGNSDGMYGKNRNVDWDFHNNANDAGVSNDNPYTGATAGYGGAFFGGFGKQGAMLEIRPIDMIGINLVLPYMHDADDPVAGEKAGRAENVYSHFIAQVYANLDFGTIAVTFKGGRGYVETKESVVDPPQAIADPAKIYIYAGLDMIEHLALDIGLGFTMPYTIPKDDTGAKDTTVYAPVYLGLGAKYDISDVFGVAFRTVMGFGAGRDYGKKFDDAFSMRAEVMPYYAISDSIKAYAAFGLGIVGIQKDDGKTVKETVPGNNPKDQTGYVGWHINPYLIINDGGPAFYVGFKLWSDGLKHIDGIKGSPGYQTKGDSIVNWAIPVGMTVSF